MRWLTLAFSLGGIAITLLNLRECRADASSVQTIAEKPLDLELGDVDLDRAIRKIVQHTGVQVRILIIALMNQGSTLSHPAPAHVQAPTVSAGLSTICRDPAHALDPLVFEIDDDAISTEYHRPPAPRGAGSRQGRWIVRGKVVDSEGKPVPRATVRLFCWAHVSFVAANEAGEFAGSLPHNGSLIAQVWDEKDERQAWQFVAGNGGEEDEEQALTLTVKPTRNVSVVVTNDAGNLIDDARVVLLAGGYPHEFPQKTRRGGSTIAVPADTDFDAIVAWKAGFGMNYIGARHEHASSRNSAPLPTATPILITLGPARPVTFRFLDQTGKPQAGALLSPWMLRRKNSRVGLNLTNLHGRAFEASNAEGLVTFDWFPEWQSMQVSFVGGDRRFAFVQTSLDPGSMKAGPIDVQVERQIELKGQVLDAAGRPARGVSVVARGVGFDQKQIITSARSRADGTFVLRVSPFKSYLLVALTNDGEQVSPPGDGVLTYPDRPIDGISLQLQPAIRVTGNVGAQRVVAKGHTNAQLWQVGEDLNQRLDANFPNAGAMAPVRPQDTISLSPDENGNFTLLLGPGLYQYAPAPDAPRLSFELTDQKEYRLEFPPD